MKGTLRTALLLGLVVVLIFAFVPSAGAGERIAASGTWTWVTIGGESVDLPSGGSHITYAEEIGTWDGTFSGTSLDTFRAEFSPGRVFNGTLWIYFDGMVNGVDGKMLMRFTFQGDPMANPMWGRWAIVKGSDGLEGVSGSGTWYSDFDAEGNYVAEYTGTIQMH